MKKQLTVHPFPHDAESNGFIAALPSAVCAAKNAATATGNRLARHSQASIIACSLRRDWHLALIIPKTTALAHTRFPIPR